MRMKARTGQVALVLGLLLIPGIGTRPASSQEQVPASLSLDEALRIALRNNPGMQAVRNDITVADWNLNSAYGALLPSASLSSSLSWQGAGEQRFGSITADQLGFQDQPSFLFSSYNAGVNFSLNGTNADGPRTGEAEPGRDTGPGSHGGSRAPSQRDKGIPGGAAADRGAEPG